MYSCMSLICLPMDSLPLRKLTSCLGYARRLARKQDLPVVAQHVDTALLYLRLMLPPAQIRSSAHTSKRTIHLRYLLVQDVREHQPADHTHDTATQTDDEQFPSPGSSEIISRTVQEQIAPLANLLRRTQEQSEAMAERCRNLEDRQSQVQLQDVSFSIVHHPLRMRIGRVKFVNAVAHRVRKLLLQHCRRTVQ